MKENEYCAQEDNRKVGKVEQRNEWKISEDKDMDDVDLKRQEGLKRQLKRKDDKRKCDVKKKEIRV